MIRYDCCMMTNHTAVILYLLKCTFAVEFFTKMEYYGNTMNESFGSSAADEKKRR